MFMAVSPERFEMNLSIYPPISIDYVVFFQILFKDSPSASSSSHSQKKKGDKKKGKERKLRVDSKSFKT